MTHLRHAAFLALGWAVQPVVWPMCAWLLWKGHDSVQEALVGGAGVVWVEEEAA